MSHKFTPAISTRKGFLVVRFHKLLLICFLFGIGIFRMDAQSLYFPPLSGSTWDTLSPGSLNWCQQKIDSFYTFLDSQQTKAFILLQDGKIVLEKYFGTHTENTPWQWASAGKTITAFMVGIAQQENHLSIQDTTSSYLGTGWTTCTPAQENKIRIWHQLTMTSGLDDQVPDHYCTLDTCLVYKADAGTRWAYHNGPYTLLDSVIETATGVTLNNYTTQKLRTPTGMTGAFIPVGFNNVFFSNARSMARFGLLMLNKGVWDGDTLLSDTLYFHQMINTSQNLNKAYGYLWWLNGKASYMLPGSQMVFNGFMNPNAPADAYAAMGKDGQFLNVVPSKKWVWLRMGESPSGVPVPFLLNDQIWQHLNDLSCFPNSLTTYTPATSMIQIYPNPSAHLVNLQSETKMRSIHLLNLQGQSIKTYAVEARDIQIPVVTLPSGTYWLRIELMDGSMQTHRLHIHHP